MKLDNWIFMTIGLLSFRILFASKAKLWLGIHPE